MSTSYIICTSFSNSLPSQIIYFLSSGSLSFPSFVVPFNYFAHHSQILLSAKVSSLPRDVGFRFQVLLDPFSTNLRVSFPNSRPSQLPECHSSCSLSFPNLLVHVNLVAPVSQIPMLLQIARVFQAVRFRLQVLLVPFNRFMPRSEIALLLNCSSPFDRFAKVSSIVSSIR